MAEHFTRTEVRALIRDHAAPSSDADEIVLARTCLWLYDELDRAQEADIAARNPGIDMDEVRLLRHYREAEAEGRVAEPYVPREDVHG